MKKEKVYRQNYGTMKEVRQDMFRYIELFYNRKRLHSVLGYMSPVEYRLKYDAEKVEIRKKFSDAQITQAIEYFKKLQREDKVKTLSYTISNFVKLYKFDGIYNYIIGDLPNSSGILKHFDLTLIKNN